MKITNEQYALAFYEALREVGDKHHDKVIENFANAIRSNGDSNRYEKIIEAYEELDRKERGVAKAEVTFAHELKNNGELLKRLNEIAGQQLEVTEKIDESLIGGIVVRVDDLLLDASVKNQLQRLKKDLSN